MWLLGRSISDHKTIADTVRVAVALPNGELPPRREVYRVSNADQAIPLAMPARTPIRKTANSMCSSKLGLPANSGNSKLRAGLGLAQQYSGRRGSLLRMQAALPKNAEQRLAGTREDSRRWLCVPFSLDKDFPAPNL
jgi:hypothetical protein